MEKWGLPFLLLITAGCFFATIEICKLKTQVWRQSVFDKNNNANNNEKDIIDFFKSLSPLGWGIFASYVADFFWMAKQDGIFLMDAGDFIVSSIGWAIGDVIVFAIFFYVPYGIMSLANSHGGDEFARRNMAGWVVIAFSFLATVILWDTPI